jgi:hypothetical protein
MRRVVLCLVGAAVLVGAGATPARADCTLNGRTYPEGAVVGGLVCEDGHWRER